MHEIYPSQEQIRCDLYNIELKAYNQSCMQKVRLDTEYQKFLIAERIAENRRSTYEELVIIDGIPQMITRNPSIQTYPRNICNAQNFCMALLSDSADSTHTVAEVSFKIQECAKKIYLPMEKLGNTTYLLRKFTSAGVIFWLSGSKTKSCVRQLTAQLINMCAENKIIPHTDGWVKVPPKNYFTFIKEDVITWEKIMLQIT